MSEFKINWLVGEGASITCVCGASFIVDAESAVCDNCGMGYILHISRVEEVKDE